MKNEKMTIEGSSYFEARDQQQREVKKAVAKCIVDNFLNEGDSILMDAGSSLYPIAQNIVQKVQSEPERTHFTIMTHNYRAFEVLVNGVPRGSNMNIVLAGGRYDQDLNALFGSQTVTSYEDFFPRVVLMGISGLVAEIGLFCHGNTEELMVKRAIFSKRARDRIIVADHTKIGLIDGFRFGESQGLKASVARCVVVTDKPRPDSRNDVRERYSRQIDLLASQEVEIKEVDVEITSTAKV